MPPLKPVTKFELNRMLHARAQELNLPGSPAGKSGHPQLHNAARSAFGVNSVADLDVARMQKLYEFLDAKKRMPMRGEV
jgi:hypothetical protein